MFHCRGRTNTVYTVLYFIKRNLFSYTCILKTILIIKIETYLPYLSYNFKTLL